MSCHRGFFQHAQQFCLLVVILCFLILVVCESCNGIALENEADYDACRLFSENSSLGFQDQFAVSEFVWENLVAQRDSRSGCQMSNLFCFPSTLPGIFSKEQMVSLELMDDSRMKSDIASPRSSNQGTASHSWSSESAAFKLVGGRMVFCSISNQEDFLKASFNDSGCGKQNDISSCTGTLLDRKALNIKSRPGYEGLKSRPSDSLLPDIDISPPLLDWGQKYLFFPSLTFLTIRNTQSESAISIFEPYSANSMFYPCNFSELLLLPGEVASICFVFLPTKLGFSSTQLVVQTSAGGFLVQAKGFAVDSPYGIQPLIGPDISSGGRWSKNLSLTNPFNEALYIEEVAVWISVSSENVSHSARAVCSVNSIEKSRELSSFRDWLDIKITEAGLPLLSMRPHQSWEVVPQTTGPILELDFSYDSGGKVFGALCLQLRSSSLNKMDSVLIPIEGEFGTADNDLRSLVSVSIQPITPCYGSGGVVFALSVTNGASDVFSIVEVSKVGAGSEHFRVKFLEELILFPRTSTVVALVNHTIPVSDFLSPQNLLLDCKLVVKTNDSSSSGIDVPCKDLVGLCPNEKQDSSPGFGKRFEGVEGDIFKQSSVGSTKQPPSGKKALDIREVEDLILMSWKSQATAKDISVLDEREILFPMVQVGSHSLEWVAVRNPSKQPVAVQLILNSGEIIDDCRTQERHLLPPSSSSLVGIKSVAPGRYGFSMADIAISEALIHPHGRASLGPVVFHPSDRCGWRSSVLIRNNLSGLEWLPLRGFGGSMSLVLLEGSEPVESLEFRLNLPTPFNFSTPSMPCQLEDSSHICSRPLSKELYAKNMGDLPLEVKKIEVSGAECGLDGFIVHPCDGFFLEPGESTRILISYQTDFSAATVQRDLELGLATGILVIPMKASLPMYMLHYCKKSVFWTRVKKSLAAILLLTSVFLLVFCCISPHLITFVSEDFFVKSGKSFVTATSNVGNSYTLPSDQKSKSKFAMSSGRNEVLISTGEEETLMFSSVGMNSDAPEKTKHVLQLNPVIANCSLDSANETQLTSSSQLKSTAVRTSDVVEAGVVGNLTVKIGKGRRRRKRKSSGPGVSGFLEVSSSHSGNSTPSSPLSPVASTTPKRPWSQPPEIDQCVNQMDPFTRSTGQQCQKRTVPGDDSKANDLLNSSLPAKVWTNKYYFPVGGKPVMKPVLLPSATFPSASRPCSHLICDSSLLASPSTIAPHARAPGSKLLGQNLVQTEDKTRFESNFIYDIWGDHLFGPPLIDRSEKVAALPPYASENKSDSFFVRGPQTLMTNLQQIINYADKEG